MEKISIIIPIYNVEKYIRRCLDSVINQTYKNLEIILVDDGSTDQSGKICDRYALEDNRIIVIHKTNEGLSDARNAGLDIAMGEYILYVDGDDYVTLDYAEVLYKNLKDYNADISFAAFDYVYEEDNDEKNRNDNHNVEIWQTQEIIKNMLLQRKITTSVWGVLSKRCYWDNIRFPVGKLYEDLATSYKIYSQAQRAVFQGKCIYFYLMRSGSIQNSTFSITKLDELQFALECKDFIKENYPNLEEASINRLVSSSFHILFSMGNWRDNLQVSFQLKQIIKQYRRLMVLGKDVNKKVRLGCLCTYLGFNFTRLIYLKLEMRGKINL
jgi:glycosyltransferase involved in cell wall biosynthesis